MKKKDINNPAQFFDDKRDAEYFTDKELNEDADLHLHTYYSDGSMSPTEIVAHAHSQCKHLIAITDHDGIDGVSEAVEAGRHLGIEVIPGIEFSTADKDDIKMHMLGYLIDTENKHLREELEDIRIHRIARNEKLLATLNEMGYTLMERDLVMRERQEFIGKPIFARALAAKGYIDFPEQAFGPGGIFRSREVRAIRKNVIDTRLAMDLIHEAGGKAVLAHPGKIRLPSNPASELQKNSQTEQNREPASDQNQVPRAGKKSEAAIGLKSDSAVGRDSESMAMPKKSGEFYRRIEQLIKSLVEAGLDGLECYHTDHTAEDTENLLRIAKKYDLWITRGSDYHGPEFENRIG